MTEIERRHSVAPGRWRQPSRRAWLTSVAAGAVASHILPGRRQAAAIEPFSRPAAKFKFSLAAYSYRESLQGDTASRTLYDFANDCARFQLDGTELTSYYFDPEVHDDELRRLRRHCFRLGLDISGTAIRNDFGLPEGAERDREIAHVKRWVERAAVLGAPVIRIFAGDRDADATTDEVAAPTGRQRN